MTRVLQVRRGTTQENDKFTGMIGEITMDTDAKTLRIHDGETLGGYELARTDTATSSSTFDISTVPDDFWANIVKKFSSQTTITITRTVPINSKCSFLDLVVGGTDVPRSIQPVLVCQSSEAGYAVGDEVWAFGIGNRTNPMPNIKFDDNGLHICLMVGKEPYWVSHRETGETTQITDQNWCILFRVCC